MFRFFSKKSGVFCKLDEKRHVRYWHKADMPSCAAHVRFRGQSGHDLLHCKSLLLTQSGHWAYAID